MFVGQDGLPAARIQRRVEIVRLLFATDRSQDSRAEWIELHWEKEKKSVYFIIIIYYFVVLCYQCRRPLVQTLRRTGDQGCLPTPTYWERREQQESYH